MVYNLKNTFYRLKSSSLFYSSGIYTILGFTNAAIPLLLLPILTKCLTPSDYGIVAMFQLVVSIVYPFIGLNLESSIGRKYFDKDDTDFPSYVGTCFVLFLISLSIFSLLYLSLSDFINKTIQIPAAWLKYVLVVAACQFITTVILGIFQVRKQAVKYGFFQISQSVLNVGLTILLVIVLRKKWDGRLEAQIITGIFFAIVAIIILIKSKQIKFDIKKKDAQHALKFGVPLIPHVIGGMLFTATDRFFLTKLVGLEQTGNYTVAYQLGAIINLVTFAFNNAYVPWLFESLKKDDLIIKKKIVKFTYLYFVLLFIGAILLLITFPFIISLFVGKTFKSINTYSTFIVFGFVFQGMYYMVADYIIYAQKTYIQSIITISVGVIKLPITYFAILTLGAIGASFSYCITFFLFFISTWILSAKVYKMPWFNAFNL